MNTKIFIIVISIVAGLFFSSCGIDDEVAKPLVTISELGQGESHGNNHKATIGQSLHLAIEIEAEEKINFIQVKIHLEGEHGHEGEHEEWEVDTIYSGVGITGLKNLHLHKDLKIDEHAEAGDYHFYITVVDMGGNSTTVETELELVEQPTNVSVSNLSINGGKLEVSRASGSFNISFDASAKTGTLASYSIEAHNHPASGKEEDEFKIIDDEFTADFSGNATATVTKTISINPAAPLGSYHLEIIIKDSEGKEKVVTAHIDLIN